MIIIKSSSSDLRSSVISYIIHTMPIVKKPERKRDGIFMVFVYKRNWHEFIR